MPKINQNLPKIDAKTRLEKVCKFEAKVSQKGAKMEPKWRPNRENNVKKTSTKNRAFPDAAFQGFLMILELFLDRFLEPLDPRK